MKNEYTCRLRATSVYFTNHSFRNKGLCTVSDEIDIWLHLTLGQMTLPFVIQILHKLIADGPRVAFSIFCDSGTKETLQVQLHCHVRIIYT